MHDDFFVLWRDTDGGPQRRWLRVLATALLVAAGGLGAVLAMLQSTIDAGARFEYGTTRRYEGVLVGDPVPLLVTAEQTYLLVRPLKYGFDPALQQRFGGRPVRLEATLIERGEQKMLEVVDTSVQPADADPGLRLPTRELLAAEVSLEGEIVDSKCHFGVMNPGHLKPHRACAINCLRGGIPPVLLVSGARGRDRQVVLVSADGVPLRDWILPFVAEPVRVRGVLSRLGKIELLEIEPGSVVRRK